MSGIHLPGRPAPSPIPGVPAHAVRKAPDGSYTIDIGAMNRGEKVDFILVRWGDLEARLDRVDRAVEELARLNYVAGAAVEALARVADVPVDRAIELVMEEATKARDEVRARQAARQRGEGVPASSTTMKLTEALARWANPAAPAAAPVPPTAPAPASAGPSPLSPAAGAAMVAALAIGASPAP